MKSVHCRYESINVDNGPQKAIGILEEKCLKGHCFLGKEASKLKYSKKIS